MEEKEIDWKLYYVIFSLLAIAWVLAYVMVNYESFRDFVLWVVDWYFGHGNGGGHEAVAAADDQPVAADEAQGGQEEPEEEKGHEEEKEEEQQEEEGGHEQEEEEEENRGSGGSAQRTSMPTINYVFTGIETEDVRGRKVVKIVHRGML